jgi:hypothetical protein
MRRAPLLLGLAAVVSLAAAGCAPKVVRERVFEKPGVRVELRHTEDDGKPVARLRASGDDLRRASRTSSQPGLVGRRRPQQPVIRALFVYDLAEASPPRSRGPGPTTRSPPPRSPRTSGWASSPTRA